MREDYIDIIPEKEVYTSEIKEELDSLYEEISTIPSPLEDDLYQNAE